MTRHNLGFMVLDAYAAGVGNPRWRDERQSLVTRLAIEDQDVLFAKPQTFMNKSGESVRALIDFYKIELAKILVIHDEIEVPFGSVRVHRNRGPGGHNGLKSLNEHLGTQDFARLRLGVGRSSNPQIDVAAHVLQNFSESEQSELHDFLSFAGDAMEAYIFDGYDKAASKFTRDLQPRTEQ